jgi:branched-chain amino acid transport system ATP-binding protein
MNHMHQPLLVVQHLSLSLDGVIAIDDLSFVARDRQVTALIGPQGAGKTSVLNCITGFCRPSSGRLEFHSRARPFLLERMEACRITREAQIARTFRNPRIFRGMTVLENILVAQDARLSPAALLCGTLALAGKRSSQAAERAHYWLDKLGLRHLAGHMATTLLPPLKRRLEIVRALASGARLICMDEPDNGLDEWELDQLLRQLLDSKAEAPAMLITDTDLKFTGALGDHVVALDRGVCIATGSTSELCGHAAVLRAWLGVAPGGDTVPRIPLSC